MMDAFSSPLLPDQEATLSNEFASVSVQLTDRTGRPRLRIIDLASGRVAEMDPAAALSIAHQKASGRELLEMKMEIDRAANGPRLKVTEVPTGMCVYLDPLELSDAAVTGAWAKLPPAYGPTHIGRA